jgi:alginate O-acetyltransferase complex protein AlgI
MCLQTLARMLFDSPIYFLFLLLVVAAYWCLGWRAQNRMLLVASCFFYGWWDWRFLLLMLASTTVDFLLAQRISDSDNPAVRRCFLAVSLIANFSVLGFFKYFDFFAHSLVESLASIGVHSVSLPLLRVLLPPGISFYTFQAVAYIIDVYRGRLEPSRRFVDYGLFISLFPHLIAGPIQRPEHLLPQVQQPRHFDGERFFGGLMLILLGLFRKSVIADNAVNVANAAFDGKLGHNFVATIIGVFAFALQIYGDFSGYSDIARGSAQLLGFHFMVNFRQPYLATSLQEFWRRWHISLSTWLRDYLYFSLGGNRRGAVRTYLNLMTTMLLGGLWHGANWTFVVWGGLQGCWLSIERMFRRSEVTRSFRPVGWLATMIVVGLSWLFFRARDLSQAMAMLADLRLFEWRSSFVPILTYIGAIAAVTVTIDLCLELRGEEYPFEKARPEIAITTAALFCAVLAVLGPLDANAFIYFQF